MSRLWAPWRIDYILGPKPKGCIFCDKVKEADDRGNGILLRGELAFVMLNAYPYNPAHVMISPYDHVDCLEKLAPGPLAEVMTLTRLAEAAIRRAIKPEGFNVGLNIGKAAGAGIEEHLHMHLLPRWSGDVNFMPALGETHVIPEALLATYDKLKPHFDGVAAEARA
ncbi:MAG: HIT domain-containing protein [Nitrospirae bacterium]|nr:HIT domain-containing protein [Nitrospirota bacterium]